MAELLEFKLIQIRRVKHLFLLQLCKRLRGRNSGVIINTLNRVDLSNSDSENYSTYSIAEKGH